MHPSRLATLLKKRLKDKNQAEVCLATGVSQPQVSRILRGKFNRVSSAVEKLCKYAEINHSSSPKVPLPKELLVAVRGAWDGSSANAKSLTQLINALHRYNSTTVGK